MRAKQTAQRPWAAAHSAFRNRAGFTLLEIMIAIGLFALILTGIYSTWTSIMHGGHVAKKAAADVQRSRIALQTLHDAFTTAVMFTGNIRQYAFLADTSGDMAVVSLAARLPENFPGMGRYGDLKVRRVTFSTRAGKEGNELIMTQAPMLLDTNSGAEAYSLTLARDVTMFKLLFYDARKNEWLDEWKYTNSMPKLVQIALGLGNLRNSSTPSDVSTTIVSIPSNAVSPDIQGLGAPPPKGPGGVPPGGLPPGQFPPGTFPPGTFPPGARPGFQPNPVIQGPFVPGQ